MVKTVLMVSLVIFYNDKDGNEHQVATHDDGMKFAGDDGQADDTKVIKKHLNNVVDILVALIR